MSIKAASTLFVLICGLMTCLGAAEPVVTNTIEPHPVRGRVLALGDSITYAGTWLVYVEVALRLSGQAGPLEMINAGLPSETVSGLSEPGHADGQFPRPDLHERLARALKLTRPDVVLCCYGMNDGIYYPYSAERSDSFQRGMRALHSEAVKAGARVIHITPPVFDPLPIKDRVLPAGLSEYRKPFSGYNQVLDLYSEWMMAQQENGWEVVDAHSAMNRFIAARRATEPAFTLSNDGVHPSDLGHWIIARALLQYLRLPWGAGDSAKSAFEQNPQAPALLDKVALKQRLLRDAWLMEIGHKRPGIPAGPAVADALSQAVALEVQIQQLAQSLPEPTLQRNPAGTVTVTSPATNFMVRYTLDGSEPTRESGAYLSPIDFPWRGSVRARLFAHDDSVCGPVAWAAYDSLDTATARPPSPLIPITQNRDWRVYDWVERHSNAVQLVRARKPDLVFIGDSITHFFGGEPISKMRNGAAVWDKYYGKRNAVNLGFGWDRTENVLWRIRHGELDGAEPKAVVVLIGTNNLDQDTPEEISSGVGAICNGIHSVCPRSGILLLGVLPRSERPDKRRPLIKELNSSLAKLDGTNGVLFLDIGARFLKEDETISKEVMADFLHPTARGYEILAESIEPVVKALLRD